MKAVIGFLLFLPIHFFRAACNFYHWFPPLCINFSSFPLGTQNHFFPCIKNNLLRIFLLSTTERKHGKKRRKMKRKLNFQLLSFQIFSLFSICCKKKQKKILFKFLSRLSIFCVGREDRRCGVAYVWPLVNGKLNKINQTKLAIKSI